MPQAVQTRRQFDALSQSRCRGTSGPVWVTWLPADSADAPPTVRVAFAIGKAVGSAVVRNRLRRQLRSVIHDLESSGRVVTGTYLIGIRPAAVRCDFDELSRHLIDAMASATR